MPRASLFTSFLLSLSLVACGGGGSSSDSAPASASAGAGNGGSGSGSGNGSGGKTGGGNASGSADEFGEPNDQQIRPGVEIVAAGSACTSNFLYRANDVTVFIGVAAHCFSPDSNDDSVSPCEARNENIGFDQVQIENASQPGTLIYSSWRAMQENGVPATDALCDVNDFALVQIHPDDLDNIHPSAFVVGGPTALYTGLASVGDRVFSYGQSSLHFGVGDLEEKQGQVSDITGGDWIYQITSDNPGLPGDSGSAVIHEDGRALGVLSTVGVRVGLGSTVNNGVVNLEKALNYAKSGGFIPASTVLLTADTFSR